MKFSRMLCILLYVIGSVIVLVLLFAIISIAPVDRTPIEETAAYRDMMVNLNKLDSLRVPASKSFFRTGIGKVNLTPPFKTATAGYGKRMGRDFTVVHDSLYVRTVVIDNGATRVAIVSADLLIIPPTVTAELGKRLPEIGFSLDNTFLGAIHTHNSIGNWGEGAARFIYGGFEEEVVDFITSRIVESIELASRDLLASTISHGTVNIDEGVSNRVIDNGPEDPLLRFMQIERADSSKIVLLNYTAHATCLSSKDLGLSRDYPGKVVDRVEASGYDFAMFMAGAVGSHGCGVPEDGMNCVNRMGEIVADKFISAGERKPVTDSTLLMTRIDLLLPEPQVKIQPDWKIRGFMFETLFGHYPAYLTALRIGDVVLLGVPCDFSGEFDAKLDSVAAANGKSMMVSSFNGGYIGYVTPKKYYDVDHYETQLMNWYPPGAGEYLTECLSQILADTGK